MVDAQEVADALNQQLLGEQEEEHPERRPLIELKTGDGGSTMSLDDLSNVDITLMTLRKPTELKKVVDSIPKPIRAVPKNGLPLWYKLGLESKLPVPKMPAGKIIFSRGKIGEDVRHIGLGSDFPRPTFDLTDPYCYSQNYNYVPMHDPHLAHYFAQKPARERMKQLGFCTKDGRAVCSLREFNLYRMYLYNRFMDRIHLEMKKMDERARDDLALKRVDADVARRAIHFTRAEKARETMEKHARQFADEEAEKIRRVKEQEQKVKARMKYLEEMQEKQRQERVAKAREQENRIKQRVQTAAEMELRRKITMLRQWRQNEKRRVARLIQDREQKERKAEEDAQNKWQARVEAQNYKIQKEAFLLKLYMEDMTAASKRRIRRSEIHAYNTDLALQRIRLQNWKLLHGGAMKAAMLVKKMGKEFERSKRGAKGMNPEVAQEMAKEAMKDAVSNAGDALMTLAQARAKMDQETILPTPPVKLLEEMLETAIAEFARRRVHLLLRDVEKSVHQKARNVFFKTTRPSIRRSSRAPRYSIQLTTEIAQQYATVRGQSIAFAGQVAAIPAEMETDNDLKAAKDRTPTPVPSLTKLAEVTFTDKAEDLPDPVSLANYMPERKKLLDNVFTAAKILSKSVSLRVQKGMDLTILKVTLPRVRGKIEWGEAVECMAEAIINHKVSLENADLRRTCEFLSIRVLEALNDEMKVERQRRQSRRASAVSAVSAQRESVDTDAIQDQLQEPPPEFYNPENVKELDTLHQGRQEEPETQP